jgi:hypothetical protein
LRSLNDKYKSFPFRTTSGNIICTTTTHCIIDAFCCSLLQSFRFAVYTLDFITVKMRRPQYHRLQTLGTPPPPPAALLKGRSSLLFLQCSAAPAPVACWFNEFT